MLRTLSLTLLLAVCLPVLAVNDTTQPEAIFTAGMRLYDAGDYKSALAAFERAVSIEPENDRYIHWTGKACGRLAEAAGPFSAMRWASRTREAFERAVELNPENAQATADLAEYYEQAPGFLGGDVDKARALRAKLATLHSEQKTTPSAAPAVHTSQN